MNSGFSLKPQMHLRRPQDFERVYDGGVRAGDPHLLVFALRNNLPETRLGMSVSKKHGSAVHRNLKRRRMREAFRLLQHELPAGLDLILVPRQRTDSTQHDFQTSLLALSTRLGRRVLQSGRPDEQGTDRAGRNQNE